MTQGMSKDDGMSEDDTMDVTGDDTRCQRMTPGMTLGMTQRMTQGMSQDDTGGVRG